jgi:hypothetical protein
MLKRIYKEELMANAFVPGRRESSYVDPYEDWASEDEARAAHPGDIWRPEDSSWYAGSQPIWRTGPAWVTNIDADTAPLWGSSELYRLPSGPYTGVGPRNYRRSDARILEDVSERLMQNGQIDASNISVGVSEGLVELNGSVNTRREKHQAEFLAASVPGVVDVENHLKIRNNWRM